MALALNSAWCYVDESCPGGNKGSFGRRHEVCTPEPPPPPKDEYNYSDYLRNSKNEEYTGKWKAPADCPCSGWKSKLGFGGYCKAWEEKLAPHQTPWCYVADNPNPNPNPRPNPKFKPKPTPQPQPQPPTLEPSNPRTLEPSNPNPNPRTLTLTLTRCYVADSCVLAEKKKGSFGRKHMDCTYVYEDSVGSTPKPLVQGPIVSKASKSKAAQALARDKEGKQPAGFFSKLWHGRRLEQEYPGRTLQQEYPATRSDRKRERQQLKSNLHVAEETALLARVAHERPRWVALVSAATHGFVTVEPPPHKSALIAHAKTAQLSILSIFALLPSGAALP